MFWDIILKYSFDSKFQQMISISPKHFKKFVYMIGVVTSFPTQNMDYLFYEMLHIGSISYFKY